MFIDTHVHLHFPDFREDMSQVIERAREAGVKRFVNIGTDLKSSLAAIQIAKQYDFVSATVGLHPHEAKHSTPEMMIEFQKLAEHPEVVAIGEVGLDFYRKHSDEAYQRQVLSDFFRMATKTELPLVLHLRDAYDTAIDMMREELTVPIRGVSHCFAGTQVHLEALVELGLHISFSGIVTYKKNDALREAVKMCPVDRILIETDAPYLAPQAFRGERNEPAYMMETARWVAELKGLSLDQLGEITSRNAERLFGLADEKTVI